MEQIKINSLFSLDSLQVRVPFDKVEYYDKEKLDKHIILNERTGEILGHKNVMYKHTIDNLINVYFSINEYELKAVKYKVLTILVSSKILKTAYFSGIKKSNIKFVYNMIQKCDIAKFSFETFENSNIYDTDIKFDNLSSDLNNVLILESSQLKAKVSTKNGVGYKYFNTLNSPTKAPNLGLQFGNDKRTGNNNSDVLLKFYSKRLELLNRSYSFFKAYFPNKEMPSVLRSEFTIKNQTRFNKLTGTDLKFTLKNVLNLSQKEIKLMYIKVLMYHFININEIDVTINKAKNTKTMDFIEIILLMPVKKKYYENLQHNYLFAVKHIEVIHADNKDKKSRYKAELEDMYSSMMKGKPIELNQEKNILETLKNIFPC